MKPKFRYIDLFSGIGGFHQALSSLGGVCVFSSEIDRYAIASYFENYGIDSSINIRDVKENSIPDHDILCAGFPCQAFSKAGKQKGFSDETKGTLFFDIERILLAKKPKFFILENVRNLVSHDKGNTWQIIKRHLKNAGYRITENPLILSPHHFGIPQLRERVVIMGIYDPKNVEEPINIQFDHLKSKKDNNIYTILEDEIDKSYDISEYEEMILEAWNEFYQGIDLDTIGFPVWAEYFKIPPKEDYPEWKKSIILKNNSLYQSNKSFIDTWLRKYNNLNQWTVTHRKFEWQAGSSINSIWEGIIQFRPSGIRVKVPTSFPALVAMVQIPIIGKYKRRLSIREAARLQSFPESFIPYPIHSQAYKQLGNAVNVEVIKRCAQKLIEY